MSRLASSRFKSQLLLLFHICLRQQDDCFGPVFVVFKVYLSSKVNLYSFSMSENMINYISVLCKFNNTVVTIWWVPNIKYTFTGSLYRTQVGYIVSVTCHFWQLGTLMYKKDNYVTVLSESKIAIFSCIWHEHYGNDPKFSDR